VLFIQKKRPFTHNAINLIDIYAIIDEGVGIMTLALFIIALAFSVFLNLIIENLPYLKERNKKKLILKVALMLIVPFLIGIILGLNDVEAPLNITFFVVLVWATILEAIFHKSIKVALISLMYIILWYLSIGAVSILFLTLISREDLYTEYNWGLFVIGITGVTFPISLVIRKLLKNRGLMNVFHHKIMNVLAIIIAISLTFVYFTNDADVILLGFFRVNATPSNLNELAYVLLFISIGVTVAVIMRYMFKESALQTEKLINTAFTLYVRDLETAYTGLRTIKHDHVNIMSTMKIYLESGDINGLKKYYDEELKPLNQSLLYQDKLMISLQQIAIKEIKSILAYKGSKACEQNVEVYIEANDFVDQIGASTAVVCQILGILLDNGIEGALETDDPKLWVAVIKNAESTVFIVKNTWNQQVMETHKFFELGFSTKGSGRGTGLDIVNRYMTKVKNLHLETEVTAAYFIQTLTVKDEVKC